jgi:hypothetical protein
VRGRAFKMKCKQCGNVIVVMPSPDSRKASHRSPRIPPPAAPPAALPVAPPWPAASDHGQGAPAGDPFAARFPDPAELAAPPPRVPLERESGAAASMGPGGRPHVDPFAALATEPAVDSSADAFGSAQPDGAKVRAEESFADLLDDSTGARPLDPQASGEAQQQGPGEVEASFPDLPDPSGARPLAPRASGEGPRKGLGKVEAPFADLSRDVDASTGERPLVPQGRGVILKLAPTPVAESLRSVAGSEPVAGAEEEGVTPAPPPALAVEPPLPAKKPAVAPAFGAALALVAVAAGGGGWLYLRSGGAAPASAHPAVAAAPANRASPAQGTHSPTEPPRGSAASEEDVEVPADEEVAAKGPHDPRVPAKRKPADRQPLARKMTRPQAKATAPPAAPEPRPEPRPEPPHVAVSNGSVPAPAPAADAPAGGPLEATPAPPPQASNADLAPLDEGKVEATFASHMRDFEACVADARANEPGIALDGRTVTVTMTVNPNGKVLYPTLDDAALSGTGLGSCIKRESAKIQFPAFGGGSIRLRKSIALK